MTYVNRCAENCPEMELVAVAEPNPIRRNLIRDKFGLSEELCFGKWEGLKLIDDGRIGKVMNIEHTEGVGDMACVCGYVRGDWHKTADSMPMILAKSCHDIDVLQWLADECCTKMQSIGSLRYFCGENKLQRQFNC